MKNVGLCVFSALRVTAFVSAWNNSLTFLSFSGYLCLPLPFWFILSPLRVSLPLPLFPSLSLWNCNVPQNRQHQFCRLTKVALASANWTDLLWVSLVAVGVCLSGEGHSVWPLLGFYHTDCAWNFDTSHHRRLAIPLMVIHLSERDAFPLVCVLKNIFYIFWIVCFGTCFNS